MAYEKLTLWKPGERRALLRDLTLEVPHGTNLLITGPDSNAKTTLFMATARVWRIGEGRISRPAGDGICFVPRAPLAVRCGLRSQLIVGYSGQKFSDDQLIDALRKVGLEQIDQSASAGSIPNRIGPVRYQRRKIAFSRSPGFFWLPQNSCFSIAWTAT